VYELPLVLLLLVVRALDWVGGRNDGDPLEEQVLRLDITVMKA